MVALRHAFKYEAHFLSESKSEKGVCFFVLLKFAIKDFKDDREYKNLSPKTIESWIGYTKLDRKNKGL